MGEINSPPEQCPLCPGNPNTPQRSDGICGWQAWLRPEKLRRAPQRVAAPHWSRGRPIKASPLCIGPRDMTTTPRRTPSKGTVVSRASPKDRARRPIRDRREHFNLHPAAATRNKSGTPAGPRQSRPRIYRAARQNGAPAPTLHTTHACTQTPVPATSPHQPRKRDC